MTDKSTGEKAVAGPPVDQMVQRERDAIIAYLRHESERGAAIASPAEKESARRAAYGGGSLALHLAALNIAKGDHEAFSVVCVGCGEGIGSKPFRMDDNGETGCPACFTDDGHGECWRSPLSTTATPTAPGVDGLPAVRSAVFEVLRRHDVSEQCFAEVAMVTHAALQSPATAPDRVVREAEG